MNEWLKAFVEFCGSIERWKIEYIYPLNLDPTLLNTVLTILLLWSAVFIFKKAKLID